jgi:hypothetical protein
MKELKKKKIHFVSTLISGAQPNGAKSDLRKGQAVGHRQRVKRKPRVLFSQVWTHPNG